MEGTSIVSIEFILAILVILAILLVVFKVTMTNRLRGLEDTVYELTEENEALQKEMKETKAKEDAAKTAAPVAAASAEAKETVPVVAAQPVTNHLVPVGQRNLAVVTTPVEREDVPQGVTAIPETVVAVIMAAVAAMGYSPAAIRAIRPKQRPLRRNRNWVMAGRMANMK